MIKKIIPKAACIIVVALLLFACSVEEEVLNNHHPNNSKIQTRKVTGSEVFAIKRKLEKEIQRSGKIKIIAEVGNSFRTTTTGYIDYTEVLEVIDSMDIKNFTFRVKNHPEDSYTVFHNLVLTEIDNELEITLMKYEMTEEFAPQYWADPSAMKDFQGRISAMSFSFEQPCEEVTINYPPVYPPSNGDGNGGGPGDPPPPTSPPDNPGPPSGGGPAGCVSISLTFVCTNCNQGFANWEAYEGSACQRGNYGLQVVISYSLAEVCRSASDPCAPDGTIGVLDPDPNSPCNKIKSKTQSTAYMTKFNNINKNENFILNHETGFYEKKVNGATMYYNGIPDTDRKLIIPYDACGFTHVHNNHPDPLYNTLDLTVKMLSPGDLDVLINTCATNAGNGGNMLDAYGIMISNEGIFALTVIDPNLVYYTGNNPLFDKFEKDYEKKADRILKNTNFNSSQRKNALEKMLLQSLKELGLQDKIALFEGNVSSNNIDWTRKTLDSNNNVQTQPCI